MVVGMWGPWGLDLTGISVLGSQPCGHWFVQSTENCMRVAHTRGDCKGLEENCGGLRRHMKQPASRDSKSGQQTPEETRNAFIVQERDRMRPEQARRVQKRPVRDEKTERPKEARAFWEDAR
jgi:hypothetical protein